MLCKGGGGKGNETADDQPLLVVFGGHLKGIRDEGSSSRKSQAVQLSSI